MAFSVDVAYVDFFKGAAQGKYNSGFIPDRLKATGFAAFTATIGTFRSAGRVIDLVIEVAKVCFYLIATIFTCGMLGNAKRLLQHSLLLALDTAALVAQPLQVIIHTLAIAVGIVSPKIAYHMMAIASTPLAWITSHEEAIWQQYREPQIYSKITNAFKSKMANLFQECSQPIRAITGTIITEFSSALNSALLAPLGFMNRFHSFGANPDVLIEEQKNMIPILLLHGDCSHQGTFLPFLHALNLSNKQRPVYTLNLPPYTDDSNTIMLKINAIKQQYGKENEADFEIDIIGHSNGSYLIYKYLKTCLNYNAIVDKQAPPKHNIKIRHAVTLGMPMIAHEDKVKKAFDILGIEDRVVQTQSSLPETHYKKIKTGHLGLLYHPESVKTMVEQCSPLCKANTEID